MSPAAIAEQNTKSKSDKKIMTKRKKHEERSNASFLAAKDEMKKERKKKKARLQTENNDLAMAEVDLDQSMSRVTWIKDKKDKKNKKNEREEEEEIGKRQRKDVVITDARFASAQLDPRFQRMPRREAKVPIDSRFARMLSDRSFTSSAARVDKRGKSRKGKEVNPLLHYYLHEKEPEEDAEVEREQADEENGEQISTSSYGATDESSSTTDDETDDDDDCSVNSDICRYLMASHEDTPTVDQETHRLAIVNMDWDHIKSVDLYVVLCSCLPKSGQILSVTIYPSEFGLKCMEVEAVHGPASLIRDNDEEQSEEEPGPEVINEKLRVYEMNKLRYYYAVAVFDSSATANHVYNTLDGTELTRTSNVFDLRFIPDSMEFKHPPRDVTEEAPASYKEPDFQTRALQHCKVNLTWEDDEPQRIKTLRRKFNIEKLDDLNEYLASTDDSDEDHGDKEKLRALLESNNNSDTDRSKNDKDMEITFNTGLEDLSKRILEKKDGKRETAWDQVLRKRSEKRKARQNRSKYSSDDDISDYDVKEAPEQPDDFFVEESSDANIEADNKKNKRSKDRMKNKRGREHPQEIEEEQEASRAELELLFAEDQDIDKGLRGYNMKSKKTKGKKRKESAAEEKLPNVDWSNDPRFASLYTNHLYALDPTDPHYKRSVAFARKQMQKQIGSKEKDVDDEIFEKQASSSADEIDLVEKLAAASSKNEKHELSSIIRSLKRNIGNMKK